MYIDEHKHHQIQRIMQEEDVDYDEAVEILQEILEAHARDVSDCGDE